MSSDRRTFLLQSTAAVASLLLPEKLLGLPNNNDAAAAKAVAFTGGHWFDGQTFRDNTSTGKPLYAVNGWFTEKKMRGSTRSSISRIGLSSRPLVKRTITISIFLMKNSGRESNRCTCETASSISRTLPTSRAPRRRSPGGSTFLLVSTLFSHMAA